MKKKNPLLTIICITYNHQHYIKECLDGFIMQKTNFPFKIIVHDDASTDNTQKIINDYLINYPNLFHVIYQKENQHSKNVDIWSDITFPLAKGKYIAFCEGDDFWTDPFKLQKQVDFLESNLKYSFCFHDVNLIDDKSLIIKNGYVKKNKKIKTLEDIINGTNIPTCTIVFRNIIGDLPKNINKVVNRDTFLFIYLGLKGNGFLIDNINNSSYRIHDRGIWTSTSTLIKYNDMYKTYLEIIFFLDDKYYKIIYRKLASITFSILKKNKKPDKKIYFFILSFKYFLFYIIYSLKHYE